MGANFLYRLDGCVLRASETATQIKLLMYNLLDMRSSLRADEGKWKRF